MNFVEKNDIINLLNNSKKEGMPKMNTINRQNVLEANSSKRNVDILFIIPPFHRRNGGGSFFPLGLGYIISAIKSSGYSWEVINCTEYIHSLFPKNLDKLFHELKNILSDYNPTVIGIGPCVTTQLRALEIISRICKEMFPNVPFFAGGPLPSIENQEWVFYDKLGIDYLIKGDGELAVVDVIRVVKDGKDISKCKYVSYCGYSYINFIDNIDEIPFPYRPFSEKDKFSIRRSGDFMVQAAMITSRGCPYSCSYCVSGGMKHNNIKYRKRSVKNIVDEMTMLYENNGINDIVFYDDCFFHSAKTVNADILKFCSELESRDLKVKWQIEMRPDVFCCLSDQSIRLLQKSGCRQISLGIEKVSSAALSFLGKQNCWSNLGTQINKIKWLSDISISATFILGGKNETEADIIDLINKSKELDLDFAHYNPLFIYPGTSLYNTVFSDEREWVHVIFEDQLPWGEIVYENEYLSKDKLLELVDYAYAEFYSGTPYAEQEMVYDRFNLKQGE